MGVRGAKRGHLHRDTIPGIRGKGAGHEAILAAGRSGFVWMGRNKDPTSGADPRPANRPQRGRKKSYQEMRQERAQKRAAPGRRRPTPTRRERQRPRSGLRRAFRGTGPSSDYAVKRVVEQ